VAYVRRKKIDGNWYFYLVDSKRVNGRVMQKVVCYMGQHGTVKAAYKHWQREAGKPGRKTYATGMLKKLKPYI
jgi:hypothetical protein